MPYTIAFSQHFIAFEKIRKSMTAVHFQSRFIMDSLQAKLYSKKSLFRKLTEQVGFFFVDAIRPRCDRKPCRIFK